MGKLRPSPSESATLFKVGTKKKGNDGNIWIITETKTGVKRWSKNKSKSEHNKYQIKMKGDNIDQFKLSGIKKLKEIGKLPITSKIVTGEFYFSSPLSNFTKGIYNVYKVNDNLVISKKKLNKIYLNDTIWKEVRKSAVSVDGGTFGFWDLNIVKKIADINQSKYKTKSKISFMQKSLPTISNKTWKKYGYDKTFFVKINDLENADQLIELGFDKNQIIGVISPTDTGDGEFGCYINQDKDSLLLIGGLTQNTLYDIINKE